MIERLLDRLISLALAWLNGRASALEDLQAERAKRREEKRKAILDAQQKALAPESFGDTRDLERVLSGGSVQREDDNSGSTD